MDGFIVFYHSPHSHHRFRQSIENCIIENHFSSFAVSNHYSFYFIPSIILDDFTRMNKYIFMMNHNDNS
jgi:hypothetical protein